MHLILQYSIKIGLSCLQISPCSEKGQQFPSLLKIGVPFWSKNALAVTQVAHLYPSKLTNLRVYLHCNIILQPLPSSLFK